MLHDAEKGVGDGELGRRIVRLGNEGWELVEVETTCRGRHNEKGRPLL